MNIYNDISAFGKGKKTYATIGTFDGIHLGHLSILSRLTDLAKQDKAETVVLTFHPHPRKVLFPSLGTRLLTSREEKTILIESLGVDHLIIQPFTKEFSRKTAVGFVRDMLVNRINIKMLVIGHDHHFGRNREGSYENLLQFAKLYRFKMERVGPEKLGNTDISSSGIRKFLEEGKMIQANSMLGYRYFLTGKVVHGDGRGVSLGFPTANIEPADSDKLIPQHGVYAVCVEVSGKNYNGMMNIGLRPTFHDNGKKQRKTVTEVHIFDYSDNIYDHTIKVSFVDMIRDEKKYENSELLKKQIAQDREKALSILSSVRSK